MTNTENRGDHDGRVAGATARGLLYGLSALALAGFPGTGARADVLVQENNFVQTILQIRQEDIRFGTLPGFVELRISSVGTTRVTRYLPLREVSQIDVRDTGLDDAETILTWRTYLSAPSATPRTIVLRIPRKFHPFEKVLNAVRAAGAR